MAHLIAAGGDFNCRNKRGETPLHLATRWAETIPAEEVVDRFECRYDNEEDMEFRRCHNERNLRIVKLLLRNGADPAAMDEFDTTPLHMGVIQKNPSLVQLLLDAGGDINIVDFFTSYNALRLSMDKLNYEIVEVIKRHIVKLETADFIVSSENKLLLDTHTAVESPRFEFSQAEIDSFREECSSQTEINCFREKCSSEVQLLKTPFPGLRLSFFDILHNDERRNAAFLKNQNINRFFRSLNSFKFYNGMLAFKLRKAINYNQYINRGREFFYTVYGSLPELLTDEIFKHLEDVDIKNLSIASYL